MKIEMKDLSDLRDTEIIDIVDQDQDLIVTASIRRDQSICIRCETVKDFVDCRISEEYIVNLILNKNDIIEKEMLVRSKDFEYIQSRIEVKIEDARYLREDLEEMIELEIIEKLRSQTVENPDSAYLLRFEDE